MPVETPECEAGKRCGSHHSSRRFSKNKYFGYWVCWNIRTRSR